MGMKVEMTFRRLNTADGIANYFWKARPVRGVGAGGAGPVGRERSNGDRDGKPRHQGPGRHRRHGLHPVPRALGHRASTTCSSRPSTEGVASAGVEIPDIDAWWLGTAQSGMSGITLAAPLKLENKPVTRVENYCATGSEALRQACYAVASGAYDVAAAVGVEKVKDGGYQGLNAFPIPNDGTARSLTAAAMFSLVAPAYAERYGVDPDELRRVLARIASKNHANGAKNPRAQFRREMDVDAICKMPAVAGMLSVFDCAGVADGSRHRHRRAGRGRVPVHRQADLREGAVVRGRQRVGPRRSRLRLHPPSPSARPRRRTPTPRPASPIPAPSWPWPRCTTASRRPSWS